MPRLFILSAAVSLFAAISWCGEYNWKDGARAKIALHAERLSILSERFRYIDNYYAVKAWETAQMNSAAMSLADAIGPDRQQSQVRLEAYFSEIDNSSQPFWTYTPAKKVENPGLLLFLHGYSPSLNRLLAPRFPKEYAEIAEKTGAYVAAPFGRGNTDFQHIGEADVLRVIDEMAGRYGIDRRKVVLSGYSMGGMGVWCIGARHPSLFNALVIISGRGDFYLWHNTSPEEIPAWQRKIIDTQFATGYIAGLTNKAVTAIHGRQDELVACRQGEQLPAMLKKLGSEKAKMIILDAEGHDSFQAFISNPEVKGAIIRGLTEAEEGEIGEGKKDASRQLSATRLPGDAGSRAMNALLKPFVLVAGEGYAPEKFSERIAEWERFAHGMPFIGKESTLTAADLEKKNLIVFGEPEESRLIRMLFTKAGVTFTAKTIAYSGKVFQRSGRGFIVTLQSPFNPEMTAVVQCGLPWAAGQTDNHRFDRIPDVICYTEDNDEYGYPVAEAAGFLHADGFKWAE